LGKFPELQFITKLTFFPLHADIFLFCGRKFLAPTDKFALNFSLFHQDQKNIPDMKDFHFIQVLFYFKD
jgi:hypothetical protein